MDKVYTRKVVLFLVTLVTFSLISQAQIGIGTTSPNASAQLDVTSSTKGFLPPRVSLTATNAASPITSPANGLLVYNTATAGSSPNNVTPGYYYWDGSSWQRVNNGGTAQVPAWTSAGAIVFGGTTTAPTLGTTVRNNMSYRQLGPKEWEVVMSFATNGSGSAGSGDYLFTLPNGLSFDLTAPSQRAYTGSAALEMHANSLPTGQGDMSNNGTGTYRCNIVIYNSTQFRIATLIANSPITPWGANFFQTSNIVQGNWTFRFTAQ